MGNDIGLQYIMDGNGNYYRLNAGNQLVVAGSKEEATIFTFYDANQRIEGGKKAKFYQTIPVEDKVVSIAEKGVTHTHTHTEKAEAEVADMEPEMSAAEQECTETVQDSVERVQKSAELEYDIAGVDWLDYMNHFCYLTKSAKNYRESMTEKLSEIDKEICDLLHYLELYDLSAEEMMNAAEMLKDARQRRRDVKDEMVKVEWFQQSIGTSANVAKAQTCIKSLKGLGTRVYHPRELSELFKGMKGRKTDRDVYRKQREASVNGAGINDVVNEEKTLGMTAEREWEAQEMEYCRRETIYDGKENDWLGMVRLQRDFFENVQQYMMNLELDLEELDQAIEDALTVIEDARYNVTQGYQAFKELKELRNERKEKLAELRQLQAITRCFDCAEVAETYQYVVEDVEDIVFPNLAEEAEGEQEVMND